MGGNVWKSLFPAQGKVREFYDWSGKFWRIWRVKEKSGNMKNNGCGSLKNTLILFKGKRYAFKNLIQLHRNDDIIELQWQEPWWRLNPAGLELVLGSRVLCIQKLTLDRQNYPWLELIFMITSLFEPLKFYCMSLFIGGHSYRRELVLEIEKMFLLGVNPSFFKWFLWLNPIALRKAKIVYNFGLSECNITKELQLTLG